MGAMLFDFYFEEWMRGEEVETTNIVNFLKILGLGWQVTNIFLVFAMSQELF